VSVWAGANDIFQDLPFDTGTAVGTETAVDVSARLGEMVFFGAKNLLVFNLPDFGVVPRYASDPLMSEASDAITAFNATLGLALDGLELVNPDLNIFRVDAFSIFNDIIKDPTAFGFADVDNACIETLACILGGKDVQDTYLFWDEVHPTQGGHRLIEAAARQALSPALVPLPAGAPLYLLGMIGLGVIARRR
jgi:outer membrane lipase/esterase